VEDKEVCKCGKASVDFIIVGEDRWTAKLDNATAKRGGGKVLYRCISCGEEIAFADSAMMTVGCI
jgi:hypothetical protein